MNPRGYLIYHLNLAFSSIEEEARSDIIQTCYHPLLQLVEETGIPIGIELTGWTLKQIEKIDPAWIDRFKVLLDAGDCELIGSGYSQIISPLIPSSVNEWNQKLGLQVYEQVLGLRPNIALVNEMAYSSSLVELYAQNGYQGFIMDRDNVRLALGLEGLPISEVPTHAKGVDNTVLPVLWADSILFQKMQHYAHGDIAITEYLDYLKKRISNNETLLPIYCNDAEVFDSRPGRFSEERPTHPEGEWIRVRRLLKSTANEIGMEWVSPTQALKINDQASNRKISRLNSGMHPIPVKKQAKYNIARWAVTGRDDLWLNTMCYRMAKYLCENKNKNPEDWSELCELWASDLRTHITKKRWQKAKKQLSTFLKRHNISENFGDSYIQFEPESYESLESVIGQYRGFKIVLDMDDTLLRISTPKLQIELNLRRGLTINSLAFSAHGMEPCIGTLPHGYFSSIKFGADYYSGGVVIEMPIERRRITDLEKVIPYFSVNNKNEIEVHVTIPTSMGDIYKVIRVSPEKENIELSYHFPGWDRPVGSVRLGNITLLPELYDENIKVSCIDDMNNNEIFVLDSTVSHHIPSSTLVSSSGGVGATTGSMCLEIKQNNVQLQWNTGDCAVMPMLQHDSTGAKSLSRVFFSMLEVDDTSKKSSNFGSFSFSISAVK